MSTSAVRPWELTCTADRKILSYPFRKLKNLIISTIHQGLSRDSLNFNSAGFAHTHPRRGAGVANFVCAPYRKGFFALIFISSVGFQRICCAKPRPGPLDMKLLAIISQYPFSRTLNQ